MKEKLQNIFGNQQKIYDRIKNTYATKAETNKSLVFNTKANLDQWLGKSLFTMPSIKGTDSVYNQYSIIPDEENEGYFAYKLDVPGLDPESALDMQLAKITLKPGSYVITKSNYVYLKDNKSASTASAATINYNITETREVTIYLKSTIITDNDEGGTVYVPGLFVHIKHKTPYIREDGLTKEDLKTGDLLLVQEENTLDYWDGEGCVRHIHATYATKDELNEINNKFNTFVGVGTNIDDAEDYHKFFVVIE